MATSTPTIKFYKDGDSAYQKICFTYPKNSPKLDDVVIGIDGLSTVGITTSNVDVSKGIFNVTAGEWLISTLVPGKQYCATIYFTIDDTCVLQDGIRFTLDDNCGCGPDACVTFTGLGCCDLLECVESAIDDVIASCDNLGTH